MLDVIELVDEPDKRRLFFWRDILGDKHFDYVICRAKTLEPLVAVELDDPRVPRRSTTADDVKATAARNAGFPLVRFSVGVEPDARTRKAKADRGIPLGTSGAVAGGDGVNRVTQPIL